MSVICNFGSSLFLDVDPKFWIKERKKIYVFYPRNLESAQVI